MQDINDINIGMRYSGRDRENKEGRRSKQKRREWRSRDNPPRGGVSLPFSPPLLKRARVVPVAKQVVSRQVRALVRVPTVAVA
jgi:hypothetical protein